MMMVTGEYDNDRCVGWVVSGGIVGDTKIECIVGIQVRNKW